MGSTSTDLAVGRLLPKFFKGFGSFKVSFKGSFKGTYKGSYKVMIRLKGFGFRVLGLKI